MRIRAKRNIRCANCRDEIRAGEVFVINRNIDRLHVDCAPGYPNVKKSELFAYIARVVAALTEDERRDYESGLSELVEALRVVTAQG